MLEYADGGTSPASNRGNRYPFKIAHESQTREVAALHFEGSDAQGGPLIRES